MINTAESCVVQKSISQEQVWYQHIDELEVMTGSVYGEEFVRY